MRLESRVVLGSFLVALTCGPAAPAEAATFAQRTVVTVDRTRIPGVTALADFPLLVSLSSNALRTTGNGGFVTSSRGHDIVFQGEDAATCAPAAPPCRLAHEIESYEGTTGTLVAWVRVPALAGALAAADSTVAVYYGDAGVTCAQEDRPGVWSSGFWEVFHMNAAAEQTDSTVNAFTAAGRGAVTYGVAGKVGRAVDLAGGTTGTTPAYLNVSDGTLSAGASFTIEAWVNFRGYTAGNFHGVVTKGRECLNFDGDPDPAPGFCVTPPCGDWVGLYNLPDGVGNNVFSMGWAAASGACKPGNLVDPRGAGGAVVAGTWYHVAATFDAGSGTRRLYVDGVEVANDSVGACLTADIPHYARIGADSNLTHVDGQLDEIRASSIVRSPQWIQASHDNQHNPVAGGFYGTVAEEVGSWTVATSACPPRNPCAGGPGTCNLRSIGTAADYSAGTVSVTAGSSVVTGSGTAWATANRGRGDRITIGGTGYTVLAVDGETQLRLTAPFPGPDGSGLGYSIARKFPTPAAWEDCVDGPGGAGCENVSSSSLVADGRSEVGILYEDSTYTAAGVSIVDIDGSTTDPAHTITLTADGTNRHYGISGAGVVLDNGANLTRPVVVQDQYATVEWLEVRNGSGTGAHCIDLVPANAANQLVVRNILLRNCAGQGIRLSGSSTTFRADITNNVIYRGGREGVRVDSSLGVGTGSLVRILNNTFLRNGSAVGIPWTEVSTAETPNPYVVLRNNILVDDAQSPDAAWNGVGCTNAASCAWFNAASGSNVTGDPGPPTGQWKSDVGPNPGGGGLFTATEASLSFVNAAAGSENLHLMTGSAAFNRGVDLTGPVNGDIDAQIRTAPWDVGADELPAAAAPPLIAYSDSSPPEPALRPLRYTTLQGASWSAPGQVAVSGPFPTGGDWPLFNKVARTRADGLARGVVFVEADAGNRNPMHATFWDGTSWTNGTGNPGSHSIGQTGDVAGLTSRHFDAAFEQRSGDLLVVTGINADESVDIYLHSGAAWSGNLRFTPAGNGVMNNQTEVASMVFRWVRLEPRPGTNRIAFVGLAHDTATQTSGVVHAAIWNGDTNSFGSKTILSLPVTNGQNANLGDAIDIDYVLGGANAGEAVAVWGNQTQVVRRICSAAGTWGANATVQDLGAGNTVRWLRQKAASNSDDMILAIEDVNEKLYTVRYDGNTRVFSSFTGMTPATALFGNADANRPFDVAWDLGLGSSSVLLVYSDATGIRYRTSADGGSTWTGEQTLTTLYRARWVQLERDPSNVVHLVVMDQNDDLRAWTWAASTWTVTTPSLPSTDLERNGASLNVEGYALAPWPPLGGATTAVTLMSFSASPADGSIALEWRTGSELDNLGFHVWRGASPDGPWTRLTSSLVPGLGSSPLGQAYSWLDSGLVNGQRYYYRLEDVDTASVSTFHGPVSAVPSGGATAPPGEGPVAEGGPPAPAPSPTPAGAGPCPAWVAAAYRQAAPAPSAELDCVAYGRPEEVSVRELSRGPRHATVELRTGGFYAVREPSGAVRVFVPGTGFPDEAGAPALPIRRLLVEAVVGRGARVVAAEAHGLRAFPGLRPSAVGSAEMQVAADGTVRAGRRAVQAPRPSRGYLPRHVARLAGTVFQGERKSATLELSPVRFDAYRGQLVLARRVVVRVAFSGRALGETGVGSSGRLTRRTTPVSDALAVLHTTRRGLHAARFEEVFPGRQRRLDASLLRLQQGGRAVPFRVEPPTGAFGPGGTLFFVADRVAASTSFSSEVAWELVRAADGATMPAATAAPRGVPLDAHPVGGETFETNRVHQPGLLDAPDVWLWDGMASGVVRVKPFVLTGLAASSPRTAELAVHLQGGSDAAGTGDHHVRVSVNGVEVGEAFFDGKLPHVLRAEVPLPLLREGPNELALSNVGDTGRSSLVFLDRFDLAYPQASAAREGRFEGAWPESGPVEVSGIPGPAVVVDLDGAGAGSPVWLSGFVQSGGTVRFEARAGHRYALASAGALPAPRASRPTPSTLRMATTQADYLVIGPRELLPAAEPLLGRRESEGLGVRAISLEEITDAFGHGQPSGEAIRDFLAYAYHRWARPSPRYVVLLGDSTYDPQRFQPSSWSSPLPALWTKTSYLWTASDPLLGAVNGDDPVPDVAVGRLPARTIAEAEALVAKLLAWEDGRRGLGGPVALVADDPDAAGDFEADVEELAAGPLAGRAVERIKVRELGAGTRAAIQSAFDSGLALMSYVGHGGAAVWASENVWNSYDAASLRAQGDQPLLLTLNCLNGYFVAANFDALAEAMVKVEGRGAIAALSPSGLSLDGPAHRYHGAVLEELARGTHDRLGDALLAAQETYARTGLMPELLSIYHLFGDPAMRIR